MTGPDDRHAGLGPASFESCPSRTEAGHCRTFEETWARLEPLLPKVPVTRVYDATPLDVIGLPVWSAVTPLATDLTVHAGKGTSPQASRISAVMEAVERVCAESMPAERTVRGAHGALPDTVDPSSFALPFGTPYRPGATLSWTGALDLMTGGHHWVPVDLVVSPGRGELCSGTETNGLASGNTYTEAALHALYEVIERDAVAVEEFHHIHHDPAEAAARPVRLFDPATLPPVAVELLERLVDARLRVQLQDCTTALGIPVFAVVLVDESYPGAEGQAIAFAGYGADLDPVRAMLRAITEAAQAHTGVILGARDEFEGMRPIPDRAAMLQRRIELLYGEGTLPFPAASEPSGADLFDDLHEVLRRLCAAGYERCLVTSLTRPDLGIPVVRVLVPGLASPYPDSSRAPVPRLLAQVV